MRQNRMGCSWLNITVAVLLWAGWSTVDGAVADEVLPRDRALPANGDAPPTLKTLQYVLSPTLKNVVAGQTVSGVVTSQTISLTHLTPPSLWWIADQLASQEQYGNKFIQEWVAYPIESGQPGRIDLLVNRQQWSLMDYLQRYEFVHRFGTVARGYGYNTRVYDNPENFPVALLVCQFPPQSLNLAATLIRQPDVAQHGGFRYARRTVFNDVPCDLKIDTFLRLTRQRLLDSVPPSKE